MDVALSTRGWLAARCTASLWRMPQPFSVRARWEWAWQHRKHSTRQGGVVARSLIVGVIGAAVAWFQNKSDWFAPALTGVASTVVAVFALVYGETLWLWIRAR